MPGTRRTPGTYQDYPELPEFTRITLGSSDNPTIIQPPPERGAGGAVWGDPSLLCGQGSKR
eukprot:469701-Prymnesium_polylepis.1